MDFPGGAVKCTTWFKVEDNKYQLHINNASSETSLPFK
jgi:hypothetical protein